MVEISEACRLRDKYIYWTEFEPTRHHFFKIMIGDFRLRLRIPRKFVINFKEKLADTILLKGPSGKTWTVKLIRTEDDLFFQNGWEDFVRDHILEDTNFLVFRYHGNSTFKVLIFDATGCEREGSYFVKEHSNSCSNNRCVMQEKKREDSVEITDLVEAQEADSVEITDLVEAQEDSFQVGKLKKMGKKSPAKLIDPDEAHEHILHKGKLETNEKDTSTHNQLKGMKRGRIQSMKPAHAGQKFRLEREEESEDDVWEKPQKQLHEFHPFQSIAEKRKEYQRMSYIRSLHKFKKEEESIMESDDTYKMSKDHKRPYWVYFNSNRREVTEEEKQRTYELAARYSSGKPSFLLTMTPSNVYKCFEVIIPKEWATKHIPCQCQEIQLSVHPNKRKWAAQLRFRKKGCMLTKGWDDFVMANNLEEDDACVFKLAQDGQIEKESIILDVIIFRVVEELVPLTRFSDLYWGENSTQGH